MSSDALTGCLVLALYNKHCEEHAANKRGIGCWDHNRAIATLPLLVLLLLLLLQEVASISAPGSIFAGNFLTAEGLALLHSRSASTAAAAPAAAGTTTSPPDGNPSAAAAVAANSEPASSTSTAVSSRVRPSGLMSQFKWGCPDDVEQVSPPCCLHVHFAASCIFFMLLAVEQVNPPCCL
jgi:hypothetical protein